MNHQGSLSLESCCLSVLSRPCWPCCVPWLLSLRVSVTHVSQEGLGWKFPSWVGGEHSGKRKVRVLVDAVMGTGWGIAPTFRRGGLTHFIFIAEFV